MHDLQMTFKRSVALPVANRKIKTIAAYLGYKYPETNNYELAWLYYRRWLQHSDVEALARAVSYQRADVEALLLAWRWLVSQSRTSTC